MLTTPMTGLRVLVVRTLTVLLTSLVVITPLTLLSETARSMALAWVLPALAVTSTTAAGFTVSTPRRSALTVAVVWIVVVLAARAAANDPLVAFGPIGQPLAIAVTVAACAVTVRRRARSRPTRDDDVSTTIDLTDIAVDFDGRPVLTGVDLVRTGGLTAVLGANGSGKTTLLRCLATVLRPGSGRIRLDGLDPDHEGERIEIRRRLGYLPQHVGTSPGATVFDSLDVLAVMKEHRDDRRRHRLVFDELDRFGLRDPRPPIERTPSQEDR